MTCPDRSILRNGLLSPQKKNVPPICRCSKLFFFYIKTFPQKIQFSIYSIFKSKQTKYISTHIKKLAHTHKHTPLRAQERKVKAGRKCNTILPSILLGMQIPICGSTYDTTRTLTRLFTTSLVNRFLFFFVFFLRGVRIKTTQPLRTAVALLHDIHIWILR